jgi:hypothetical protein
MLGTQASTLAIDGFVSGTPPTESQGFRSRLNIGGEVLMPAPVIQLQPAHGSTFGQLLMDVRDCCHAHQIKPVAFTYSIAGVNPEVCIEFSTDAEMNLFALNFTGGSRLLDSPTLGFAVDFTV